MTNIILNLKQVRFKQVVEEFENEKETSENLRRQLKEYLEEATKLKMELSEAKREIFKLQNKK